MELKTYLEILWRRKWVIVITTVVTTLVTASGIFLLPPTYEATTTLRVAPTGGLSIDYTAMTYATQLKNTLIRLATSDKVLDDLVQRLGLDEPPKVKLELLGNSELVLLKVQHPSPRVAQEAANSLAEILIELNRELYVQYLVTVQENIEEQLVEVESELNQAWEYYSDTMAEFPDDLARIQAAGRAWELTQEEYTALLERRQDVQTQEILRTNALSVFDPADLPEEPAGLPKVLYIGLGIMIGLTAGMGLAFLFENLDTTLHTTEQIEAVTELPILGRIPTAKKKQMIVFFDGRFPQEEAYHRLRINLLAQKASQPLQALVIASAEPKEGKTTILANLACVMAKSGCRVVVVDGD
jgi:capsular polysaccharide biosynthesis protein